MTQPDKSVGPMLSRRFVFGVQNDVKDGCLFIDETTVAWAVGKNVVIYNTQDQTQKFIPCSETCEKITAMAISPNRRSLAVAEMSDTPCIAIYDTLTAATTKKRKRMLQFAEAGSREYVCIAFSADGRYLVSQAGFPDWHLVLWNAEKGKPMAYVSSNEKTNPSQEKRLIKQCSISPRDSSLICVSGMGIFKFFRYDNNQLRPMQNGTMMNPSNNLAHVWLPPEDRLVVSTDNGDLLLVENGEFKNQLALSPSDGLSIDTLIAHSKGFICGGDLGLVTIFERSEDKELYRKMRTIKVDADRQDADSLVANDESVRIVAFSLTPPPSEEYLTIMTSNKQLFNLNLSNADFSKSDDKGVCDVLAQPFHAGAVTGLDICIRKPLLVTCGKDRNVFIWNYQSNSVEVAKRFGTEVLSVAIHPSGLHLLLGFQDKLRFMNIYGDDIREFRNFAIRSCSECRFSNGGQYFAAMHSTIIHVYFTYTCELMGHLRAHGGKVKSIYFVPPDDTKILSAGIDGAIYEFTLSLDTFSKTNDYSQKAISYSAVTGDDHTVWITGNDRKIRQLERQHFTHLYDYELRTCAANCLALSINLKLLFAGCEDGTLRVFNTYLADKVVADRAAPDKASFAGDGSQKDKVDITVESHAANNGSVSRVALSFDESIVASVGDDGVLTLWNVVAAHRQRREVSYAEEILVDKKDLEERNKTVSELNTKVADLKQRMDHAIYKRERKHEEKIQELREQFQDSRQKQAQVLEKLMSEKNEQAFKFRGNLLEMESKQREELAKTEREYQAKIKALTEQAQKYKTQIQEQRDDHNAKRKEKQEQHESRLKEQAAQHRQQMEEAANIHAELSAQHDLQKGDHTDYCETLEEQTDADIIKLKEENEQRMSHEQDQCAKLKAENSVMQSKETMVRADLDAKRSDIQDKLHNQATLHVQIQNYQNDLKALRKELHERAITISDKEKRIFDLQKKNEELGKFKFVLEYKIQELKDQIDPREAEIKHAHAKYAEMEVEAERYLHSNESLVLMIRGNKLKHDGHAKEIESLKGQLAQAEEYQTRLLTELTDLYEEKNPRKVKDMTKALYYKYTTAPPGSKKAGASGGAAAKGSTDDAQRDYNRGRDYLEKTVAGLRDKMDKTTDTNRTDRSRIINENVQLTKEINELRREVRTLQNQRRGISTRDESAKELDIQRSEIVKLRGRVEDLERQLHAAGKAVSMSGAPTTM